MTAHFVCSKTWRQLWLLPKRIGFAMRRNCLLLALLLPTIALATEYSISGVVHIRSGAVPTNEAVKERFTIIRQPEGFTIRSGSFGAPGIAEFTAGTMTNRGTYLFARYPTNIAQLGRTHGAGTNVSPSQVVNNGMLWLENNLSENGMMAGVFAALELALVSKEPLTTNTQGGLMPLIFQEKDDSLFPVTPLTRYELSYGPPVLIRQLEQRDQKRLRVEYSVLSWTNACGLLVPEKFRLLRYGPKQSELVQFEATVDSVSTNQSGFARHVLPPAMRVVERRFANEIIPPSFAYTTTNGRLWTQDALMADTNMLRTISKNEAFLRSLLETDKYRVVSKQQETRRRIILGLLLAGAVIPLIFFVVVSRKHKNK